MVRNALLIAALLATAPIAVVAPSPASAQQLLPYRAVPSIRLLGSWRDRTGLVFKFEEDNLKVKGTITRASTGELLATLLLSPHPVEGVRGPYREVNTGKEGFISAYVDNDTPVIFIREGTLLEPRGRDGIRLSPNVAPSVTASMEAWTGRWRTTRGLLIVTPDQKTVFGALNKGSPPVYAAGVALITEGNQAYGAWEGENGSMGDIELRMAADRNHFSGWYTDLKTGKLSRLDWTGERVPPPPPGLPRSSPLPQSDPQPAPSPAPSAPSADPAAPAPAPAPAGDFKPLRRVDVRLDRIVEARGYPTRQVHAFVTLRNISPTQQYISSGYLRAILTDGDGVAQERNQVWRASGEPAALFNSTPVVQPGAELKVRYVFNPDEGSKPTTFTLSEGDQRAEFPAR